MKGMPHIYIAFAKNTKGPTR